MLKITDSLIKEKGTKKVGTNLQEFKLKFNKLDTVKFNNLLDYLNNKKTHSINIRLYSNTGDKPLKSKITLKPARKKPFYFDRFSSYFTIEKSDFSDMGFYDIDLQQVKASLSIDNMGWVDCFLRINLSDNLYYKIHFVGVGADE